MTEWQLSGKWRCGWERNFQLPSPVYTMTKYLSSVDVHHSAPIFHSFRPAIWCGLQQILYDIWNQNRPYIKQSWGKTKKQKIIYIGCWRQNLRYFIHASPTRIFAEVILSLDFCAAILKNSSPSDAPRRNKRDIACSGFFNAGMYSSIFLEIWSRVLTCCV